MEAALRFECQPGCTRCCDTRGFVYLTEEDSVRIAAYVGLTPAEFEARYVYRTRHLLRLRKPRNKQCPFLSATGCDVHKVKPVQCRVYPFWPEYVENPDVWEYEGREKCPGIGKGPLVQIGTALEISQEMRTAYPFLYKRS
jgi:Fe-S-cluster containining protein